jgi:hypothetical protein
MGPGDGQEVHWLPNGALFVCYPSLSERLAANAAASLHSRKASPDLSRNPARQILSERFDVR